ncbi:hypothetical protein F443_17755 [Phytophthora nicotianae P1569]|uniref:Uncharacterized protein n=1 Tax=Phytophthora nicotianae P1569 TaxID=1317065 RepID=V9EAP0_PHYNI|nr:hypothetical protein F443_17755 [Phytophthora nicotianae P1569]
MASTPKGLTDEEKAVASMFYRSAVKWSVRRAHHVGNFFSVLMSSVAVRPPVLVFPVSMAIT